MCESVSMCHGCVWWSEGHGWTWFSPPTMWNPGIQHGFSGLVGTSFTIRPQSKGFHYVFITCVGHCTWLKSPLPSCHVPRSIEPLHLRQTISPPCSSGGRGGSQANTAQAPPPYHLLMSARARGKPHTEPVQAVCRRFYQL